MSPAPAVYSASNEPVEEGMVYITREGDKLCLTHAKHYLYNQTRSKVNGYRTLKAYGEECDRCGKILGT